MPGQIASSLLLSHLDSTVRDRLTDWALPFDFHWRQGQLETHLATLPADLKPWRTTALAELVRIDLSQLWRAGQPVRLEAYLDRFQELGTAQTVSAELVIAEIEARQSAGESVSGDEIALRFPQQAAVVRERLRDSSQVVKPRRRESSAIQNPAVVEPSLRGTGFGKSQSSDTSKPRASSGSKALSGSFGEKGRYEIIKELGAGGMGAVYLATDTRMKRSVAIKVTHFAATDFEMRDRFIREAQLLATISHPNLGVVYDVDVFDGTHFQTMEYIEGKSLASYLKSRRLTPKQAVTLVRKAALALAEAHRQGVVHRDVKPQNIMLKLPSGEPKVIDFGLAVNVSADVSRMTQSGTRMGTLPYMPIEQINGEIAKIGPRSDVYSLGVVLYELLTGTLPFPGEFLTEVLAKMIAGAVPVTQHQTDLDPRLNVIVLKAIAKEPSDRYASMTDFAAALQAFLKSDQSGTSQTADTARSTDNPVRVSGATDITPATSDPQTTDDDDESLAVSFFDQLRADNENPSTFVTGMKRPASPSISGRRGASSSNANGGGLTSIVKSLPGPLKSLIAPSPDQRTPQRRAILIALATVFVALLYGVTLWFRSGDALVKVTFDSDDVAVTFQNETIKLTDGTHEYKVKPGDHRLHIKSGNAEFDTDKFTLKKGENPIVTVELVKDEIVAKWDQQDVGRFRLPKNALVVPPTDPEIPADAKSFETHSYKYFNDKLSWKAAKAKCESLGGNLVIIDSVDENKFVADIIAAATEDESWIGITDEAQEGSWLTVTGQSLAFTNWLQGQPDNKQSREHFALMTDREYLGQRPGWKWCDRNNQDLSLHEPGFVCEWITPSSIAKSLFNGRNLDGWEVGTGAASAWKVSQGELVALGPSDAARGWLVTTKEYRDYRLRFDVKHTSGSNSGVALRAMPGETQTVEVQLHDESKPGTDTTEIQKFGSLYTIASRNRVPKLKPLGEWNQVEIEVRGDDVTVVVNGQQVLNRNLATLASQFPSRTDLTRRSGRIGLQSWVKEVHFRNIEILELSMLGKERDPIPSESVTKVAAKPQVAKAPFSTEKAKQHQQAWAEYLGVPVTFENSIGMKFSLIPPGEFQMGGGAESENEIPTNANLRHRVTLTKPYYLGSYEARQRDYQTVKGNNPSKFSPTNGGSLDHPVETVLYEDIEDFCKKLSAMKDEKSVGRLYRVPTEAEWECACRAGTATQYAFGETINRTQANFTGPGKEVPVPIGKTTRVGAYAANAWGLFDMHGNVCEWTSDSNVHFTNTAVTDPRINTNSGMKVFKGGDFGTPELVFLSSGMRYYGGLAAVASHMGFRVLLEVPDDAASRQSQFGERAPEEKGPRSVSSPRNVKVSPVTSPERRAAEWALSKKAVVRLVGDGREYRRADELPTGDIEVDVISFHIGRQGPKVQDEELENLRGLTAIQKIYLCELEISGRAIRHVAGLKTLRTLDFWATSVGDEGLSHITGLTELEALVMPVGYTDRGMQHLKGLTKLKDIHMDHNGDITARGVAYLASLPALQKLSADLTRLDDAALVPVGKITSLEILAFNNSRVTDAGLKHLHGLKHLKLLEVPGTQVTVAGVNALKKALPSCKVTQ